MKKLTCLILAVFLMTACEEEMSLNTQDEMTKGAKTIDGLLNSNGQKEWTLMGTFMLGSIRAHPNRDPDRYGYAVVWGDKYHDSEVDGGDITIAGLVVTYNSDPYYSYSFSDSEVDANGYFKKYNPTFGATAKWKMVGNSSIGVSAIDEDIYIPKEFICTNTLATRPTIDNSQDFTLTWETDASNPNGKVGIIVEYDAFKSNYLDSTLSDVYFNWSIITDDDGSYTIPSTVLDDFPDNSYLTIEAGRAKRDVVTKTEGVYRFVTMTYISYDFEVE
jgi:hypothetical protein